MGLWCYLFVEDIKLIIALNIGFDCGIVDNKRGHSILLESTMFLKEILCGTYI